MNSILWNEKQKELFKLYFKNNEGITVLEVINNMKSYSKIWKEFYDFLIESSLDFDKFDDIDKIKIINHKGKNYLIIKFRIFDYLCIDLDNKIVIEDNNSLEPFDEQFFINYFNERKTEEPEKFYYYLSIDKKGINEIIEFINNNEILLEQNSFVYKIDDEEYKTFLRFDISKCSITLYFGNKNMVGNVNYIFLNKALNPIGASNPTGNMDELKEIASKVKDIIIPESIIPEYIISKNKIKEY